MTTELIRFTQWAKDQPQKRFTALMGLLAAEEGLAESYHRQPSNKAAGVDGIGKVDYGRQLAANLADLSVRLRRMGYRPKPSRRVYIPKSSGQGQRPIGIPTFSSNCTYRQYAFGMGRGLSPLSPATGPAFSCAKDAALIRAGDADSARSDARHPQCAA